MGIEELSEEDIFKGLSNLHGTDYNYVLAHLKNGSFKKAVDYLRFEAISKVPTLDGAMHYVQLVKKFEGVS